MKSKPASPEVDDLPALKVLLRARAEGRMPHAVLLTGADGEVLARAAERLAAIHLGVPDPLAHADCRVLRPAKKSRRINIESTQEVVAALRLTSVSARRVVLVHEPDRFMSEGANCFLKTLEEPPPGTLIVLQTANYYRVLPTIPRGPIGCASSTACWPSSPARPCRAPPNCSSPPTRSAPASRCCWSCSPTRR
jgi:DNA polymerase III delta prime subunit